MNPIKHSNHGQNVEYNYGPRILATSSSDHDNIFIVPCDIPAILLGGFGGGGLCMASSNRMGGVDLHMQTNFAEFSSQSQQYVF